MVAKPKVSTRPATLNTEVLQYAQKLLASTGGNVAKATQALKKVSIQQKKAYRPKNDEVVIAVRDVAKKYKVGKNTVDALRGVDLNVHRGEFVAITGSSGSGKSTLLHMLGGLDKVDSGGITVLGQDLAKLSDRRLSQFRNKTIGFVFQFFYLQPFLSLQTNIEVPAMFARTRRSERGSRSRQLAEEVGLQERLLHLPRELSGGQMQRAAIARAMQNAPQILLADEPTGNLDSKNAGAVFDIFRRVCDEQGTTVVVVTHDVSLAHRADRVVTMSDGAIVA